MTTFTEEDAAARKADKLKRTWQDQDKLAIEDAIKSLLSTKPGRTFLWTLLGETRALGQNPFDPDERRTAFNCGVLSVGQMLLNLITQTDPDGFMKLQKEKYYEQRNRDDALAQFTSAGGDDRGRNGDAEPSGQDDRGEQYK